MSSVKQKYEPVSTDGNGLDESFIATATVRIVFSFECCRISVLGAESEFIILSV
jgi:hypothetical protein